MVTGDTITTTYKNTQCKQRWCNRSAVFLSLTGKILFHTKSALSYDAPSTNSMMKPDDEKQRTRQRAGKKNIQMMSETWRRTEQWNVYFAPVDDKRCGDRGEKFWSGDVDRTTGRTRATKRWQPLGPAQWTINSVMADALTADDQLPIAARALIAEYYAGGLISVCHYATRYNIPNRDWPCFDTRSWKWTHWLTLRPCLSCSERRCSRIRRVVKCDRRWP